MIAGRQGNFLVVQLCSEVEYLNSRDATIMGSRNGHAPIYMWYTLTLKGYEGMRRDVEKCLRNAHLLKVCFAARVHTEPGEDALRRRPRCRRRAAPGHSCQAHRTAFPSLMSPHSHDSVFLGGRPIERLFIQKQGVSGCAGDAGARGHQVHAERAEQYSGV